MQREKSRKNIITVLLFVVLCVLSAIGIWKTIYFSADIDESYALTMALRIASGERMILDMWEPHQMSAALYAPLVLVYKGIAGSMEGALIFMRICGLVIQGTVAVFLYKTLKKDMPTWLSMVLAFAYYNFTPKHIASPEFSLLYYWAFMMLMLCLIRFMESGKGGWMVASGMAMSVIVLCYPTAVLLFVYIVLWLVLKKKKAGTMVATCAVCGGVFVLYLILQGGGFGVFEQVSSILMDESHNQNLALHMLAHLQGVWDMVWIVLALMVLCHVGRPVLDRKNKRAPLFLGMFLLAMTVYAMVQFHTIYDVNFMVFYPIVLQLFVVEWYAYAAFPKSEKDRVYFETVFPLTLLGVVAILLSSNVLTAYSMSYFMPGVILGAWQIYRVFVSSLNEEVLPTTETKRKHPYAWMAVVLLIGIVCQLMAARICLVRFTSTRKKNVFQPYYEVTHDVLKGVRLGDFDYIQYEAKSALLDKYVEEGDAFLYVGADMFLYSQLSEASLATGNVISTPAFGKQLMRYYEVHPDKVPTVVFVDREYGADFSEVLLKEPMKSFMETYFEMDQAVMEPAITVYKRER